APDTHYCARADASGRGPPGRRRERFGRRNATIAADQLAADGAAKPGQRHPCVADNGFGELAAGPCATAIGLVHIAGGTTGRPGELAHHLVHPSPAVLAAGVDRHTGWSVPVLRADLRLGPERTGCRGLPRR